MQAKILVV